MDHSLPMSLWVLWEGDILLVVFPVHGENLMMPRAAAQRVVGEPAPTQGLRIDVQA